MTKLIQMIVSLIVSRGDQRASISRSRMVYATTVQPADREIARQWMGR